MSQRALRATVAAMDKPRLLDRMRDALRARHYSGHTVQENVGGGTLIIGVGDDGVPLGIGEDGFESEDKMYLHLGNLLHSRIGPTHAMYIQVRFDDFKGQRVMAVQCGRAGSPVVLKDGGSERFYVRTEASTTELTPGQTNDYVAQRFKVA